MRWLPLVMLMGCATPTLPSSYEDQAARGQVPEPGRRPAPEVKPGPEVRARAGAVSRLLKIPAAVLAILLWPSELEGEHLSLDWTNTLNPVTLAPWSSQGEYERFWQLPQREREQLIEASRKSMGGAKSSATAAEPRAGPRRHPDQTCDDAVLDRLQAEKNRICNAMPGASCSMSGNSVKRLDRMPCSQVRSRIQGLLNCIHIRQFIQDECFGGKPDARHQEVLAQYKSGLVQCQSLEQVNCAPGHPMAEL